MGWLSRAAGKFVKGSLKNAGRFLDKTTSTLGSRINTLGRATGIAQRIQAIGDATGIHQIGAGLRDRWQNSLYSSGGNYSAGNKSDYAGDEKAAAISEAQASGADTAQADARENAKQAMSSGLNGAAASNMASANSTGANLVNSQYAANRAQTASTSADYLSKMAQADAMDIQAKNMRKGSNLATLASGVQGAGSGLMLGAQVFGSDESLKESPTDEELNKAIRQFKSLYRQVHGGK